MGQQVTKDIRSRLEHQTLEELLINDKYVEELERHLLRLPNTSHESLAKILASWEKALSKSSISGSQSNQPPKGWISSVKDKNSRPYKLGSLWSLQSQDIDIPPNVAEVLKQNPRNLLRQTSKNGVDLQSPSDYYEYTCNVETDRILCKILWRFLTTFYYDLISELDATKNLLSKAENGGVAFVVTVICQSGKHNRDIVREKVIGWAKIGRRYRGFMDALCSGCLFLFPEKISDLVWETYVPVKGSAFAKVTQFLREIGIVCKCEEEGWNDLSDQILQTLREPFRSLVPFQFQPSQQSQTRWAGKLSLASAPSDADIHRHESKPQPRQAPNRVVKRTRKKGPASLRQQLQSFTGDLASHQAPRTEKSFPLVACQSHHASRADRLETQHETYGVDPQGQLPRKERCWASAPNRAQQWHLSSQLSTNDRERDSLNEISLDAVNHDVDQQQTTGKSITDALGPERTGFGRISALLNHDSNASAIRAIQFEKHILEQIVLGRATDILGEIWFGSPPGFVPFVSLRLSGALRDIIKLSGQEVLMPEPSPDTTRTFTGVYSIEFECFRQLIQRDGFGAIFWNEYGGEAFVAMQVLDKELIAAFIQASQATISVLPMLDTVTTGNSA